MLNLDTSTKEGFYIVEVTTDMIIHVFRRLISQDIFPAKKKHTTIDTC